MNSLADIQNRFRDALLTEALPEALFSAGASPLATRFGIYTHAYRARLIGALRENYPVLHRALGDEGFEALALAYLAAHPSRHPSIRWFGHRLADFTAATPDWLPHPALHDLIRMEWALRDAFDAPAATPVTAATLAALPPEQWPSARFTLVPSAHILGLEWAIEPIWHQLNEDEAAETEAPEPLVHDLLIWRVDLATRWRSLDADEAALLPAVAQGESVAQLCERAAAHGGEDSAPARVAQALRRWSEESLLVLLPPAAS